MNTLPDAIFDYKDVYVWMDKVSNAQMPPVIIQCAITGEFFGKEYNENLPESIEEQIEDIYACYQEGASMVHIHARDPACTARASFDPEVFSRINELVRARCPGMIVGNSTAGAPGMSREERTACLHAVCKPDTASLNTGTMMIRSMMKARPAPLSGPHPEYLLDAVIPNTYGEVMAIAKAMLESGVRPEIEIFHPGQFWVLRELIQESCVRAPYIVELLFGVPTSIYPVPKNVLSMVEQLPEQCVFFVNGRDREEAPMTAMAMILGGHVRVGMEDSMTYRRGRPCEGNAELVARARRMAEDLNRSTATPEDARRILGI
jgi:3-keto-5-aminohexanoate cleavage enzyme